MNQVIRDPSDGSVKQPVPILDTKTSGLRSGRDDERLAMSREWLKEWHAARDPERIARLMGDAASD